ncbi:hypothetical protein Tco_0867631 [Tanacetum coccineum]
MILESVEHGPLIWPTIEENGVTMTKKYAELSASEKIQVDCDLKATNIILQGLPSDVYSRVNHHRVAKDLWERIQLLMQGTSLTKHESECKLYDAFDKFAHINGESLHHKFVTDVKLVKDLHTTKFDQLHAYLEQHELHANAVCLMRERNQDPLALISFGNTRDSSLQHGYAIPKPSLYVYGLLDTAYWLEIMFALNVDQSIIYGISANVDTAYYSKSSNGTDIKEKDKTKQNRTKPSTGSERARENESSSALRSY